ncbi:MAG: PrpF family protein [Alphaproteobacteria bacterium]|nr:PrpF family protein [Alphaproteobacteria bacterium]MCB9931335.1 PrpF family protein [Alphaproteobacteria bacterium]
MRQFRIPATFMRGGTSKALVFHARDLPADRTLWPDIFRAAIGANDPYGRQLDGMGGGISSLSKVCVIAPSARADADIDYSFFQLSPTADTVDESSNCGNMSSAMGPFAVDEGLVAVTGEAARVRIYNTNTDKIIISRFAMDDGRAAVDGDFELPGVAGLGSPVSLDFLRPGGARTGKILPTGNVRDWLTLADGSTIEASMVDAANPCVFVRAGDVGALGNESPLAMDNDAALLAKLEAIRQAASVAMGIGGSLAEAERMPAAPKVAFVAPPLDSTTLDGKTMAAGEVDLLARMISVGAPHRAIPLTGALCTACAAKIEGTLVHEVTRPGKLVRVGQASGTTVVDADVQRQADGAWHAETASVLRTQRRLMDGFVYVSAAKTPGLRTVSAARAAE